MTRRRARARVRDRAELREFRRRNRAFLRILPDLRRAIAGFISSTNAIAATAEDVQVVLCRRLGR